MNNNFNSLDNNGNKVYQCTESSYWAPLSGNMINIKYSLVVIKLKIYHFI